MKTKTIYWLIQLRKSVHDRYIEALSTVGVNVIQAHTFQELYERFNQKRSTTILIGDEIEEEVLVDQLPKLVHKPEFNGVRFIQTITKPRKLLGEMAMGLGFRDVLPLDLSNEEWLKRFEFAESTNELSWEEPQHQMTVQSVASVSCSARLTWLDFRYLRLETKIRLPLSATARLSGKLCEGLGLDSVNIRILERSRTNLKFRFSEAYVCEWEFPNKALLNPQTLLAKLRVNPESAPHKIFLAIQSFKLRHALINLMQDKHFELSLALQKSGLQYEAKFIDPDLVIIEHRLVDKKTEEYISKMVEHLRPTAPIYIIGAAEFETERYQKITGRADSSLIVLPTVAPNFATYIKRQLDRIRDDSGVEDSGYHIQKNHRFSFAEIRLPARLTQIHPQGARMVVPFELGRYSLCTPEAPVFKDLLERRITCKISSSYQHNKKQLESFPFIIELILSDVSGQDRNKLANYISSTINQELEKLGAAKKSDLNSMNSPEIKEVAPLEPMPASEQLPEIQLEERPSVPKAKERKLTHIFVLIALAMIIGASLVYLIFAPPSSSQQEMGKSFEKLFKNYDKPESSEALKAID